MILEASGNEASDEGRYFLSRSGKSNAALQVSRRIRVGTDARLWLSGAMSSSRWERGRTLTYLAG